MTNYIQEKQTELFNELGVFFAFNKSQFEEKKQPGVEYCSVMGAGDCVPKNNAKEFITRLNEIHRTGRELELAEKGIDRIIEEHLANHECFYTGDIQDALDSLEGFDVTHEQVVAVYNKVAHKYDW